MRCSSFSLCQKKSAQYSWSSFITLVLYLENSREEEHGKDDDLTEEEEGEAVPLGVQPDLDLRLKLKSCCSITIAFTGARTVVRMPVMFCCIDSKYLRLPIQKMVVAGTVAIENVILSEQPVSRVYLFARFL